MLKIRKFVLKILREVLRIFLPLEKRLFVMGLFDYSERNSYLIRTTKYDIEEIDRLIESARLYPQNIKSPEDSVALFMQKNLSVSRIGDGEELVNILNPESPFPELKKRLCEILAAGSDEKCLVCINNFNVFDKKIYLFYRKAFAFYWGKRYSVKNMMETVKYNLNDDYGDAYMFLFYFRDADDIVEKHKKLLQLKNYFDGKKILFVVSNESSIKKDKTFFSGAKERDFIIAPSKNAFSEYERIFGEITQKYGQDWLIYLELGACATVLSWDLSKLGYQALDAGDFYNRIVIPVQRDYSKYAKNPKSGEAVQ